MSDRFLCIHGHFYQPPRENPWLEAIELQDSAYPYHDWNERITAECYAPNTASRILDAQNRIRAIVNNYGSISFNFGPTLISWMAESAPQAYEAILAADRQSRERFSGHGSAMAQAYNHAILPLSNHTDRVTQVLWGIRDFEHRFGRRPEGMWLPEAAVDLDTLDVLAEFGIRFTVLAPRQAARVRKMPHGRKWVDVTGGRIDPSRAYLQKLPSGRSISLFFYDGPISQAVAFEHLLDNGERFAQRLLAGFSDARTWPQLMHIATDGETYGHHHPMGDMALAYALHYIEFNNLARITNYAEFLEQHPPTHEVQIVENSSWSCVHGVERWRSDCGCNTGRGGWNQKWREPLRNALDWLRDTVAPEFERRLGELLQANPWDARNGYIDVILDRSPGSLDRFFAAHSRRELSREERVTALQLLELQRHAMLMYTSCGWFFDELSGIETVQVIQYAGRVVQLACRLFGDHHEQHFVERLSAAQSNLPDQGNGGDIYQRYVKPAILDLQKVGTHYAISSLFERYDDRSRIYCYDVERRDYRPAESGRARFASGQALVTSAVTLESELLQFATVHFGDHNLIAGVRDFQGDVAYQSLVSEAEPAFQRADFAELVRILDRHFESTTYSLKSLFRDEQRKIVRIILGSVLDEAESSYRQVYENHGALMRFLADLRVPLPRVLQTTAGFVINASLRRAFEEAQLDIPRIEALLEVANSEQIKLDVGGLSRRLQRSLEAHADALAAEPADFERLRRLAAALRLARSLPFAVNLWRVQNVYYALLRAFYAARLPSGSADWTQSFTTLGELLDFDLDAVRASVQPPEPAMPEPQAA